jgi:hypothetical protein
MASLASVYFATAEENRSTLLTQLLETATDARAFAELDQILITLPPCDALAYGAQVLLVLSALNSASGTTVRVAEVVTTLVPVAERTLTELRSMIEVTLTTLEDGPVGTVHATLNDLLECVSGVMVCHRFSDACVHSCNSPATVRMVLAPSAAFVLQCYASAMTDTRLVLQRLKRAATKHADVVAPAGGASVTEWMARLDDNLGSLYASAFSGLPAVALAVETALDVSDDRVSWLGAVVDLTLTQLHALVFGGLNSTSNTMPPNIKALTTCWRCLLSVMAKSSNHQLCAVSHVHAAIHGVEQQSRALIDVMRLPTHADPAGEVGRVVRLFKFWVGHISKLLPFVDVCDVSVFAALVRLLVAGQWLKFSWHFPQANHATVCATDAAPAVDASVLAALTAVHAERPDQLAESVGEVLTVTVASSPDDALAVIWAICAMSPVVASVPASVSVSVSLSVLARLWVFIPMATPLLLAPATFQCVQLLHLVAASVHQILMAHTTALHAIECMLLDQLLTHGDRPMSTIIILYVWSSLLQSAAPSDVMTHMYGLLALVRSGHSPVSSSASLSMATRQLLRMMAIVMSALPAPLLVCLHALSFACMSCMLIFLCSSVLAMLARGSPRHSPFSWWLHTRCVRVNGACVLPGRSREALAVAPRRHCPCCMPRVCALALAPPGSASALLCPGRYVVDQGTESRSQGLGPCGTNIRVGLLQQKHMLGMRRAGVSFERNGMPQGNTK